MSDQNNEQVKEIILDMGQAIENGDWALLGFINALGDIQQ